MITDLGQHRQRQMFGEETGEAYWGVLLDGLTRLSERGTEVELLLVAATRKE